VLTTHDSPTEESGIVPTLVESTLPLHAPTRAAATTAKKILFKVESR
jgi:hypothetical protein